MIKKIEGGMPEDLPLVKEKSGDHILFNSLIILFLKT